MTSVPKNHMPNSILSNEEPIGASIDRGTAEIASEKLVERIKAYLAKHQPRVRI